MRSGLDTGNRDLGRIAAPHGPRSDLEREASEPRDAYRTWDARLGHHEIA